MKRVIFWTMILAATSALQADWPTLHNDAQRSGHTEEVVPAPHERKWFRNFAEEMIATRVEAIIGEGKVFIGTLAGNLYALDVVTGKTLWTFQTEGPIGHSPCYHDGKVYVGADEGFDTGSVYCLNAADGKKLWRAKVDAGVYTSPLCDGRRVYFGDRAGVFHALKADNGSEDWTRQTGYMILQPPSLSRDGKTVVFGSEDMHIYALRAGDGKLLWKSDKLGGLSLRDHGPTVWGQNVIVRTNPAVDFHDAFGLWGKPWKDFHQSLPMQRDDEVLYDKWGKYAMKYTERRAEAEQKFILDYLKEHPEEKTFYVLNLRNGQEPWVAPITYSGVGLHNNPPYPTFNTRTGRLYVWSGTALSKEGFGVPGLGMSIMTIDPYTGQTQDIVKNESSPPAQPSDESQALSLMGNVLMNTHQGVLQGLCLDRIRQREILQRRDSYGGIFGVTYHRTEPPYDGFYTGAYLAQRDGELCMMANEWHGPDRSIIAISDSRMFWVVGSQVVCLGGPNSPTQPSGGLDRPDPIQWQQPHYAPGGNLAVYWAGTYDESMPRPEITPEQVRPFTDVSAAVAKSCPATGPLAKKVAERLDAEIVELTEGGRWAPLIIEQGISKDQSIFAEASQAMQIVALALPHLSAVSQTKALSWLDTKFQAGFPLKVNVLHSMKGKRREPYDLGPDMTGQTHDIEVGVDVLYPLWAYAYYGNRWDTIKPYKNDIRKIAQDFLKQPVTRDHAGNKFTKSNKLRGRLNPIGEELNGQIAGMIGYIRMMKHFGDDDAIQPALERLTELVIERIHHEQADTCFIRLDRFGDHSARLPRYLKLTPEVGAILRTFCGDTTQGYLKELSVELPVWYHAWGERLIGGENYINPPHFARAMYMAWAEAGEASPAKLAKFLDQPWCKADLFYIEKCSALLRAAAK